MHVKKKYLAIYIYTYTDAYIYTHMQLYIQRFCNSPGASDGRRRDPTSVWLEDLLERLPSKFSENTEQVFQSHQAILPSKSFKYIYKFSPQTLAWKTSLKDLLNILMDIIGRLARKTCLGDLLGRIARNDCDG